ncbi:4-diphosphocytidyl-2-C-methyl-D-erythritol kinase [Coriobacterium glomerans PW2]|uniref:4-diphosphocytidyl-2-C-methyl-D-erythritol kinase n=1 Tax=Coriobacterium glomerans (strain ATCC 49209 / DSM 20642 / JCM 10262 / PW2) TaxID=700015 RepID=F2NAP4_CORGP|nr:4-(cytidine 5'-diphospho)-2-C-methyl-D-erythritol kinase [Coriobacterium glomerans]AEB07500.1 4-diphosphocytidyl-2-C-methyl-D-erythritol kinase [Coriobacterium glomerans PW2]
MIERAIRVFAPAKVNLYLGVHAQTDARGYHRVDSVMAALDLTDTVTVAPASDSTLTVRMRPNLDVATERNTAHRAAAALGRAFGRKPCVEIEVEKRIPIRAGLGGPSADAAAVIVGMCRAWGIDPADERVRATARGIGADVPFLLSGALVYCDEAGDRPAEIFEPLGGLAVALVKPISTGVTAAEAYARFDRAPVPPAPIDPMLEALREHDGAGVARHISNNLRAASCELDPQIGHVLEWMRSRSEARAVELTGSGSCVYALCDTIETADAIAIAAERERGWWSCAAKMKKSRLSASDV